MTLILASQSMARRVLLTSAGVVFDAVSPMVDEEAAKAGFRVRGLNARDLADALAELKAVRVSLKNPGAFVLGCDQTLALESGEMLDKPNSPDDLSAQLSLLSGQTHSLYSAVVIAQNGNSIWRHVDRVKLTMRVLSPAFINDYGATCGDDVMGCVGGYKIEAQGVQLFSKIEGSHFTILGLPLLPLLDYLRTRGEMMS